MKMLLAAIMIVPCISVAQLPTAGQAPAPSSLSLLSVPGMADAVATYVKQAKIVGQVSLKGTLGTGFFLPARTMKDAQGIRYASAGIGGIITENSSFRPQLLGLVDLSSCFRRIEAKNEWYSKHVEKTIFPDVWVGLSAGPPALGEKVTWRDFGRLDTWMEHTYFNIAIGL